MMENSNLPIRTWYLAMAFMSYTKKGLSAKELQRQLGHKRYDTVWSLTYAPDTERYGEQRCTIHLGRND